MEKIFLILLLNLYVIVNYSDCAKILALFPTPSRSHCILGEALVQGLAKTNRHNITYVSSYPKDEVVSEYRDIGLTKVNNIFKHYLDETGGPFKYGKVNNIAHLYKLIKMYEQVVTATLDDPVVQDILLEKYDLIIFPGFMNAAFLGLAYHFNASAIIYSTLEQSNILNDYVGNPSPYSYVPEIFLSYTDRMNFAQRSINTLYQTYAKLLKQLVYYPGQNRILHQFFPNAPDIQKMGDYVSLIFTNSHITTSFPRPLMPNVIEVGGLHVAAPKPLSSDLKKFMDDATDGVIYFSLGGNVPSKDMPIKMKNSLISAFAKLKKKVLWKWDEPTIPGLPKNVLLSKWYSQSDILAHPHIKIFMTHSGLLSIIEAVVRGVPCIGIPVFGDQRKNIKKAVDDGYAIYMDYENITSDSITWAIKEILNNPRKCEQAIYSDQIVTPMEKAIYWIEYVIRHKSAPHLRSAGADIPLYQYLLIDVLSFIFFILCFTIIICYFIARNIIRFVKYLFSGQKYKQN